MNEYEFISFPHSRRRRQREKLLLWTGLLFGGIPSILIATLPVWI